MSRFEADLLGEHHEEVTCLYDHSRLPVPTPPPMRADRATIPDLEEDATDDAEIVDDGARAFAFTKRTCVLDDSELRLEGAGAAVRAPLPVPTPRAVQPTVLRAGGPLPAAAAAARARPSVTARLLVMTVSACVAAAVAYGAHAGHAGHAIGWVRHALAI